MLPYMQRIASIPVAFATTLAVPKVVTVQSGDLCTQLQSEMVFQLANLYDCYVYCFRNSFFPVMEVLSTN